MDECTHEWYDVGGDSWRYADSVVVSNKIKTTFHGVESTMIRCAMCGEIGYRLIEVDQNPAQNEVLFDA